MDEGHTGLLVPPGDIQKLSNSIAEILKNSSMAAQFGAAGRRRIENIFSIENFVKNLEKVYEDLFEKAS